MSTFLSIISIIFVILGIVLLLLGAVGLLRFSDVFQRLHATTISDTIACYLIVLGLAMMTPTWHLFAKVLCVGLFIAISAPISSQALARSAIAMLPLRKKYHKKKKHKDSTL